LSARRIKATRAASATRAHPWPLLLLGLLTLLSLLVHLWLADRVGHVGAALRAEQTPPQRIDVAFVRELTQAEPPSPPPAQSALPEPPAPSLPRSVAMPAEPAASSAEPTAETAPEPEAPEPPPPPSLDPQAMAQLAPAQADLQATGRVAITPLPDLRLPVLLALASPAGPATTAIAATPVTAPVTALAALGPPAAPAVDRVFAEWPPSTRLNYLLKGHYMGPVEGQAQVEWLRQGTRYQVHMDLSIGPPFAPLMSRRVSSEGQITAQGLQPARYDEVTEVIFRDTRRLHIQLGPERVRLPAGDELPRPAGVQDSASQFVQLTWLFTTRPELLQPGRSVDFPLALPRRVETWTYDVLQSETLFTPAGTVQAVHVKPRREAKRGGDLTAEFWAAPSLQYLPVRILIRQDSETYLDLQLSSLPKQAAPGK